MKKLKIRFPRSFGLYTGLALVLAVALIGLIVLGPRMLTTTEPTQTAAAPGTPAPAADSRKIRARLFYVNEPGNALTGVDQEVLYGEGTAEQARRIIEAQLAPPASSLVSPIPQGTSLRTVFLTSNGEAFVDLTGELQRNHPGGTTNEILTVYALVGALTTNLPAITAVQILVEGKEVQTLGGHLDLRRPMENDGRWVEQ
jgi:spore germination protein GerM